MAVRVQKSTNGILRFFCEMEIEAMWVKGCIGWVNLCPDARAGGGVLKSAVFAESTMKEITSCVARSRND
jgi:hypothetical protein